MNEEEQRNRRSLPLHRRRRRTHRPEEKLKLTAATAAEGAAPTATAAILQPRLLGLALLPFPPLFPYKALPRSHHNPAPTPLQLVLLMLGLCEAVRQSACRSSNNSRERPLSWMMTDPLRPLLVLLTRTTTTTTTTLRATPLPARVAPGNPHPIDIDRHRR